MADGTRSFLQTWAEDGSGHLSPRAAPALASDFGWHVLSECPDEGACPIHGRSDGAGLVVNYERYRLMGDEDTGVAAHCRDCEDGGRPFAYYEGSAVYGADDPKVQNVATIPDLLRAIGEHERDEHSAKGG